MGHIQTSRLIPSAAAEVYRHITDLSLLPSWVGAFMNAKPILPEGPLRPKAEFEVYFERFGIEKAVRIRIDEMTEPARFSYRQVSGFFTSWDHTQVLKVHNERTTLLTDLVNFELPFGFLGALADDLYVRRDIERVLQYRLLKVEEYLGSR
jgi:ligand-binding SRPBCC domain-containing protein